MSSFTLSTSHGLISITDTALKNTSPALLLLHGNSSSSKIFRHMLESPVLNTRWRIVTFDLPGHGCSSLAPSPGKSYHMRGYAELACYILQHLNIASVVVFGWSLGGHIGIEMIPLLKETAKIELKGLMITGTPPALGREEVKAGFTFSTDGTLGIAGQKSWTDEEALSVSQNSAAAGKPECWEEWMYEDAKHTDGRARMMMAWNFTGVGNGDEDAVGVDQRQVVESEDVLVAVVNGAEEQYVELEYLQGIKWAKLWRGQCVRLKGLKHAPFWEDPGGFERVLVEFLQDCEGDCVVR
jgi:pimeloyl-ACP methyl ester carboxylesterase